MKICKQCGKVYKNSIIFDKCPKARCYGDIVEVDEKIAPSVILLNQYGYPTTYSCAGHWYDKFPDPYIKFECGSIERANELMSVFRDVPSPWSIKQSLKENFKKANVDEEFAEKQICLRCNINSGLWEILFPSNRELILSQAHLVLYNYLVEKFKEE